MGRQKSLSSDADQPQQIQRKRSSFFKKFRTTWDSWQLWILLATAVIAFSFGFSGFVEYGKGRRGAAWFAESAYRTLKFYNLGGDTGDIFNAQTAPWEVQVARFLAPISVFIAALAFLLSSLEKKTEQRRLARLSKHVVICGLGRKGLQIARDYQKVHKPPSIVIIESNEQNQWIPLVRELRCLVVVGDATQRETLQRAKVDLADEIFAVCGDDGANVDIAVLAHHEHKTSPGPLKCYVHIVEPGLCPILKSGPLFSLEGRDFRVRIFNVYDNSARKLFQDHPLDCATITETSDTTVHLVVVGFGNMGESIAIWAAKTGHFANCEKGYLDTNKKPLRITVIDKQDKEPSFRARYRYINEVCDLRFENRDIADPLMLQKLQAWTDEKDTLLTIAVCLDRDVAAFSVAHLIRSYIPAEKARIFVHMEEENGLAKLLKRVGDKHPSVAKVVPFGFITQSASLEEVKTPRLDKLAEEIHRKYCDHPDAQMSKCDWDSLEEIYKDSNRQQADHIDVKLRALGYERAAKKVDRRRGDLAQFARNELLAKMEHRRWFAEWTLNGWTHGNERDSVMKRHPALRKWDDQLGEKVKQYDYDAVSSIPDLVQAIEQEIYLKE